MAFLATRDIRASAAVRAEDVQAFLGSLWSRGLARSTVARRLAAVRGLHRFQVAEGVVEVDPTAGIEGPNKPSGLPKALTVDEVERLIGGADVTTPLGRRDAALIEVLYASGARVAEAVALDLTDIDLEERTAIVTGKGAKQRLVLLGGHAVAAVEAYLPSRMDIKGDRPDDGALFLNARGSRLTPAGGVARGSPMCGAGRSGNRSRPRPHVLRHSAGRRTWSREARICERFRRCWVTLVSPLRRSTRGSHRSTCWRCS